MRYVAIVKQLGQGCDYTIGCGVSTLVFEAESSTALASLYLLIEDYVNSEDYLESVSLYEAPVQISVPLREWQMKRAQEKNQEKVTAAELDDLALHERLKKKFND